MERYTIRDSIGATILRSAGAHEKIEIHGRYTATCKDRYGNVKWDDVIENVIATIGKNLLLDTGLAGSAYTVTGPYMGLISSVSFTGVSVSDTMASHSGWLEAGSTNAPTYSGSRQTCVFSSASGGAKQLSAALAFTMTGPGTVEGLFIVYGTGASSTIGNTSGTLFSAGTFTGGAKAVGSGDVLSATYSVSI